MNSAMNIPGQLMDRRGTNSIVAKFMGDDYPQG